MKTTIFFAFALFSSAVMFAQGPPPDSAKMTKYQKLAETAKKLPDMIVGKADTGPDSSMYFFKNDYLQMTVTPMWQEKGTQTGNDLKLNKINEEPFDETFPLGEKKLANGLIITMANIKKPVEDKKQMVIGQVKTHLAALYKQSGKIASSDEIAAQATSQITGPESFTTNQGNKGELYFINDYQPQQTSFYVALFIPGTKPGTSYFVQFNYYKFIYDTTLPDELSDLKVFQFPDDQTTYVDFSKKFLKTFKTP